MTLSILGKDLKGRRKRSGPPIRGRGELRVIHQQMMGVGATVSMGKATSTTQGVAAHCAWTVLVVKSEANISRPLALSDLMGVLFSLTSPVVRSCRSMFSL